MPNDPIAIVEDRAFINSAAIAIRRGAGLSLAHIGDALDVSPSTVLRWERGDRTPTGDNAHAYADLLRRIASTR